MRFAKVLLSIAAVTLLVTGCAHEQAIVTDREIVGHADERAESPFFTGHGDTEQALLITARGAQQNLDA